MKHKIITMLLSTVLFLSVFTLSVGTQNAAAASNEGIVTASSLNLRQSSSASSKSLTLLFKGTKVQVKSVKSSWMQVYVPSKKKLGWVAKRYISITKATTAKTAAISPKTYYVNVNSLKVMASSSRNAKVLITLKKGTSVTYLSEKTSWGKIKTTSGITGWVANRDLSTTKPKATNSTKPKVETVSTDKIQYVTSETLNIREEGNASANTVGVALRGDALTVTQTGSNGWGQVLTEDGLAGWVNLSYLSDSTPTNGLDGKVIVLDPGHGGTDPGALGKENKEKDLTLSTAKKLKAKLEAAGATVYMTRTGDTYPSLDARVAYSKKMKADIFISIHINSGSKTANGIETYYWSSSKNEKKLATYVQNEVIDSTGLDSRGVKTANYRVIGTTTTTQSILVELGFISNPDEEQIIETSSFQNDAATGIVNGLEAYFESL